MNLLCHGRLDLIGTAFGAVSFERIASQIREPTPLPAGPAGAVE